MRPIPSTLSLALILALLAGCGGGGGSGGGAEPSPSASPASQGLAETYRTAIEGARDQELNDAYPVVTDPEDEQNRPYFDLLGLDPADCEAAALSVSLMNVKAYGIAAVRPAEGKGDKVYEDLKGFIGRQMQSFQQYLADQYDIASHTRLETLTDGTVLLVMCENQDEVFNTIRSAIEGA